MSPRQAALVMLEKLNVPDEDEGRQAPNGDTQDHMVFMLRTIMTYDNTQKAHRWLGYTQCLAVMLGLFTLEEMKHLNHEDA